MIPIPWTCMLFWVLVQNWTKRVTMRMHTVKSSWRCLPLGSLILMVSGMQGVTWLYHTHKTYTNNCSIWHTMWLDILAWINPMQCYWLKIHCDLEKEYILACPECQCNKSSTSKAKGPLHPLPIPDKCGDSVAVNFISHLPQDEGFDCIVTMTDRLGSDIRIIPTRTDITAEDFVVLFFND